MKTFGGKAAVLQARALMAVWKVVISTDANHSFAVEVNSRDLFVPESGRARRAANAPRFVFDITGGSA